MTDCLTTRLSLMCFAQKGSPPRVWGISKTGGGGVLFQRSTSGMFARRPPGALPFYQLSRLQPEIYPLTEKAPPIDHDRLRTLPTKCVA